MKKFFVVTMLFMSTIVTHAQMEVTKFMGIPIDGFKSDMINKLKAKGFQNNPYDKDLLTGEFNGHDVDIIVATNNNKVYRVCVFDKNKTDERSIQIRFNKLCEQFENNRRYTTYKDFKISDEEDISYEMSVNKKRYEAIFFQKVSDSDSLAIAKEFNDTLSHMTKGKDPETIKNLVSSMTSLQITKIEAQRPVWFMIKQDINKYRILMFYDNELNRANGEDL